MVKRFGMVALEPGTLVLVSGKSTRQEMMERLKFDAVGSRETNMEKALEETCTWLPAHPGFQLWVQPRRQLHGFFWIKGKLGTGKSVVMKFLDTQVNKTRLRATYVSRAFSTFEEGVRLSEL